MLGIKGAISFERGEAYVFVTYSSRKIHNDKKLIVVRVAGHRVAWTCAYIHEDYTIIDEPTRSAGREHNEVMVAPGSHRKTRGRNSP